MVTKQLFVSLPLLRAIEKLPDMIEVDGVTLRFTGEVASATIVQGFSAHRAFAEIAGARGWVDLSSASTARTDMTLRISGLRPNRAEKLILALREAMLVREISAVTVVDERIDMCRTA